jgi:hypothetical protein
MEALSYAAAHKSAMFPAPPLLEGYEKSKVES